MSDLSPGIEKFLREWEETKGYGREWIVQASGHIRAEARCCPLTGYDNMPAWGWETVSERRHGLFYPDSVKIAAAADREPLCDSAIRARLLKAVGLEEAE